MASLLIESSTETKEQTCGDEQNVFCEWLCANGLKHMCDACIAEDWDDLYAL